MIELAVKYRNEVDALWADRLLDDEAKYEFTSPRMSGPEWDKLEDFNYDQVCFASTTVNPDNGEKVILGEIGYYVNDYANLVNSFYCIRFKNKDISDNGAIFMKDMLTVIYNIFNKYGFNKMEYSVAVGNPAEKQWDEFTKRANGSVVGTFHKNLCLADRKIYDNKYYELFKEDFMKSEMGKKAKKIVEKKK